MKASLPLLLTISLSLAAVRPAPARTWIVDNRQPEAADTNPGTEDKPLRTINAAAQLAEAGDTVLVHAGVYRERVAPLRGGTSEKPIVYQGAPGEKIAVKGSDVWTHWQPLTGHPGVFTAAIAGHLPANGPNPFLTGISVAPADQNIVARPASDPGHLPKTLGQVFYDGASVVETDSEEAVLTQENSWVVSPNGEKLTAHFPGNPADLSTHVIEVSVRNRIFAPHVRGLGYLQIRGFTFEHCANQGSFPQAGAVSTRTGLYWRIENNVIRQAKTVGLDIGSETFDAGKLTDTPDAQKIRMEGGHHVVQGNMVSDNGLVGIAGWHHNGAVIRHNVLERNNALGFNQTDAKWEEWGAIKLHGGGALIEGNLLRDNEAYGIWIDNDYTDSRITRNVVLNNRMAGIFLELGDGHCLVDNNIIALTRFRDAMYAGMGIYAHDASGLVIAHNLIFANADCGVLLRAVSDRVFTARPVENKLVHVANTRVLNNIIWDNGRSAISLPYPNARAWDNISDYNVVYSRRDLWLGFEPDPALFSVNLYKSSLTMDQVAQGLVDVLTKNNVPRENWPNLKAWRRNPTLDITQWRLFMGQDLHSKETPKLVSLILRPAVPMIAYSAAEPVLQMDCPPVPGVDRDFLGNPLKAPHIRPGPFQDIGAEERERVLFPARQNPSKSPTP